jgi:hypothetical protein
MIITIHPQAEAGLVDGASYYVKEANAALDPTPGDRRNRKKRNHFPGLLSRKRGSTTVFLYRYTFGLSEPGRFCDLGCWAWVTSCPPLPSRSSFVVASMRALLVETVTGLMIDRRLGPAHMILYRSTIEVAVGNSEVSVRRRIWVSMGSRWARQSQQG